MYSQASKAPSNWTALEGGCHSCLFGVKWTASHHLGSWLRRTPAESLSWFQGLSMPSPLRGSHSFLLPAAHPFAAQQSRQLNVQTTAQCCIPRLRAHWMDHEGPHVQKCLPNSVTEINIKLISVLNLTILGLRGCRSVISSLPLWAYHLWVQFVNPNKMVITTPQVSSQ